MGNSFEYDKTVSINSLTELLNTVPHNTTIMNNIIKAWHFINDDKYKVIQCSISGGSDSDILLDICCRCDKSKKIQYVFFDTGVEYPATREHLKYLEDKYGIKIEVYKAYIYGKSIPQSCQEYGQPFLSKFVSQYIYRLQQHNFKWEDRPYEELIEEYPNCMAALKWWCCYFGEDSRFNITRNKWLKEFMVENPPTFKISDKCCKYAKKNVAHEAKKLANADLSIIGVRKAEGGIRSTSYKNCFTTYEGDPDEYRPIFFYTDTDKREYEEHYGITHSKCYTEYGLKRTGCVGCPFGLRLDEELKAAEQYAPNLYKAICNIFKDSYEYTAKYRDYVKQRNNETKVRQMTIFDYLE